jgi:hypothetical protein
MQVRYSRSKTRFSADFTAYHFSSKKNLSAEFKIVDALGISFFPNASCTLIFAHFACGISQKRTRKGYFRVIVEIEEAYVYATIQVRN